MLNQPAVAVGPLLTGYELVVAAILTASPISGLAGFINPAKNPKYATTLYRWLTLGSRKDLNRLYQDDRNRRYMGFLDLEGDGIWEGATLEGVARKGNQATVFTVQPVVTCYWVDVTQQFWFAYLTEGMAGFGTLFDSPKNRV